MLVSLLTLPFRRVALGWDAGAAYSDPHYGRLSHSSPSTTGSCATAAPARSCTHEFPPVAFALWLLPCLAYGPALMCRCCWRRWWRW